MDCSQWSSCLRSRSASLQCPWITWMNIGASLSPRGRFALKWSTYDATPGRRGMTEPGVTRRLRLDDHRDDHRPALELAVDPAPDDAPDDLLELVGVVVALGPRTVERVDDRLLDLVEGRVVLREAAGVDLGATG